MIFVQAVRRVYRHVANESFKPVDIASLVVFRIAFGAIMLWEVGVTSTTAGSGNTTSIRSFASHTSVLTGCAHFRIPGCNCCSLVSAWVRKNNYWKSSP